MMFPRACSILATEQPVPEAFNDPKMLEQASKAVQCAACHGVLQLPPRPQLGVGNGLSPVLLVAALMTTTWERLTSLMNTGKDVTQKVIRTQFLEACTQEVRHSFALVAIADARTDEAQVTCVDLRHH
jgi:hypothetical protein